MPPLAEIDLRRDLPKVREQLDDILPNMGKCRYASPCVIGLMLPEDVRVALDASADREGSPVISTLVDRGLVSMPEGQEIDATDLQSEFDCGDDEYCRKRFLAKLAELEAKYLPAEAA